MNNNDLTPQQRQIRQHVRNFLLTATPDEMRKELQISIERNDELRARFIREMIEEDEIVND